MARVYEGEPLSLDKPLGWLERLVYRLAGVPGDAREARDALDDLRRGDAPVQHRWGSSSSTRSSACRTICRSTRDAMSAVSPDLSWNTAVSFVTNTNWQSYGGETTMSYLTQMVGARRAELRLRRVGHGRDGGAHPRHRAQDHARRSATSGSISCAARSTSCCRSRSSWR